MVICEQALVLRSLNAVRKDPPIVTRIFGRASPDPGLGPLVELDGRYTSRLLDLFGVSEALASQSIASEEPPPALLEVEPTCSRRNKHVVDARMLFQPGARLQAEMTREIVGDNEDIPLRIIRFDLFEQLNVAFGVARGSTTGDLLAVTYPQRPVHPGFFRSPAIIERCFNPVSIGRPACCRVKGAGDYWSEFVGADGRRSFWRLSVMDDDRRSFGIKSLSWGSLQLWVLRQRTPSRERMRRI